MNWAELLVGLLGVYAMAGVLFAVAFLWRGVERVDAGARGAGFGVRVLLAPGCVALWPLLAAKWGRR